MIIMNLWLRINRLQRYEEFMNYTKKGHFFVCLHYKKGAYFLRQGADTLHLV
jgi:hypothetical protein